MDYAELLFRRWAKEERLTPLYIIADFDKTDEPIRFWWLFLDDKLVSPSTGICDEELITWFGSSHNLTFVDRLIMDNQQRCSVEGH
jgi:hypothetical protein